MATLIDIINEYTLDKEGKRRRWEWNECDCIGLMFYIVNQCTGSFHSRASHVPPDLDYHEAIRWLGSTFDDPLLPFLKFIVDDAGVPCHNGIDWDMALMYGDKPVKTIDGKEYPIHIVPGIAVKPAGHSPYVMGAEGLVGAYIYPNDIRDFVKFKFEGVV